MPKELDILWGALFGLVLGFIISKVYETWAILFVQHGAHNGFYRVGPFTTPLWVQASSHPTLVTTVGVLVWGVIGTFFMLYIRHRQG